MQRASGRHSPSEGDEYTEHDGVAPPESRWDAERREHRTLTIVVVVLMPVVLMLFLAVPAAPYWDQPDEQATITAAVRDGTITAGRSTCDASRFTVRGPAGRAGYFRDCSDARGVGDEVTVRWRSATSSTVQVDVLTWVEILAIVTLAGAACAAVGVLSSRSERRRLERLASPTFRTRRGRTSG